jgi:hypothetical protein
MAVAVVHNMYTVQYFKGSCHDTAIVSALYFTASAGPPLWFSGRSSWLLNQRSRVRLPALPDFLNSSWSQRGPLGLVRINEELFERKVAASVYKTEINDRSGSAALTTRHPSIHKSWH